MQIVHLKRFQFVNNRWIKSQKIVRFPRDSFDPSAFLTPREVNHSQQGWWRAGLTEELFDKENVTNSGDPPSTPTSLNINNIKGQLLAITVNKVMTFIQIKLIFFGLDYRAGKGSSEIQSLVHLFLSFMKCFFFLRRNV